MRPAIRNLGLAGFGVMRRLRLPNRAYAVLLYHRVVERRENGDSLVPGGSVDLYSFREQMNYVRRCCKVIEIGELCERISNAAPPDDFYVSISFDDGYKTTYDTAVPILQGSGIPSAFFLTTGLVDQTVVPMWDSWPFMISTINTPIELKLRGPLSERYDLRQEAEKRRLMSRLTVVVAQDPDMREDLHGVLAQMAEVECLPRFFINWEEARTLSEMQGITIGAHSVSHGAFGYNGEAMKKEMAASRDILHVRLGREIHFYAYPFGTKRRLKGSLYQEAEKAGFRAAFTALEGYNRPGQNPFLLRRIPILGEEPLDPFITRLRMADFLGHVKNAKCG